MKKSFLEYVAADLLAKHGSNLSRIAVVFPNKRAALFMNSHLVALTDKPLWSPAYFTISELFQRHTSLAVGDPIRLVCELYKSFVSITGTNETIDRFFGWGQLLLSDFDDIDKNMADAAKVFAHIENLHDFDDTSYLTPEQVEMLRRFFSNFAEGSTSELKQRFMALWRHFGAIYNDFNARLRSLGIAYEGALYRDVVEHPVGEYEYEEYVFVGFNLLQVVEQRLFKSLRQEGKAKFYWDFDNYYMPHKGRMENEAGHFIAQYLADFLNELDTTDAAIYDNMRHLKDVTFVKASTETVQTQYIAEWLSGQNRIADGRQTAIVMCNEDILQQVMHSLPPEVEKANITSGFPLSQTPVASLITQLVNLQTSGLRKTTDKFSLHHVLKVLRHPYARLISPLSADLAAQLTQQRRYYPSRQMLSQDEGLALLFGDIYAGGEKNGELGRTERNSRLLAWVVEMLKKVGQSNEETDALFTESVFKAYTLVNRLYAIVASGDLDVTLTTLQRLLRQLIAAASIPFHGEPVVGTQIMGVLETRNLDFRHLLILSCNEGNMPRGVNDSSFIPYVIRKAYGLTTVDHKVAIYAYYFNRLLQRADDVTIIYNCSTDGSQTGERSRFMTQLMVESGIDIRRMSLDACHAQRTVVPRMVEKSDKVMEMLSQIQYVSPTAINHYISCQLKFYYNNVLGLREDDTSDEAQLDNRAFGNVFHKAAQLLYTPFVGKPSVTESDLKALTDSPQRIEQAVDDAFRTEFFHVDDSGFRPEYNGLQLINRSVIIDYIRQMIEVDKGNVPFRVLALEHKIRTTLEVKTSAGPRQIGIGGYIDRLDQVADKATGHQLIRIIDYKTGGEPKMKVNNLDDVFSSDNIHRRHSDYFLQTMLYSVMVSNDRALNPSSLNVSPALMFIQHTKREQYSPIIEIGKQPVSDISKYAAEYVDKLKGVVGEIFEPTTPFTPTADTSRCALCPYAGLCSI